MLMVSTRRWFPRSSVGTYPGRSAFAHRRSGSSCIPTPERGNDQSRTGGADEYFYWVRGIVC